MEKTKKEDLICEALEDIKRNGLLRQDVCGKDYVSLLNFIIELIRKEGRQNEC